MRTQQSTRVTNNPNGRATDPQVELIDHLMGQFEAYRHMGSLARRTEARKMTKAEASEAIDKMLAAGATKPARKTTPRRKTTARRSSARKFRCSHCGTQRTAGFCPGFDCDGDS